MHQVDVAAGLKAMKGETVTTHVLATELAGPGAPAEVVESKKRALQRYSKDRLRAYVKQLGEGRGHATLWALPPADENGRLK